MYLRKDFIQKYKIKNRGETLGGVGMGTSKKVEAPSSVLTVIFLSLASSPFQDIFFPLSLISNKSGTQEMPCIILNMDHSCRIE